mmetsp:Transcript_39230/g.91644  ORF Transcript_39230/g.91644 Transcript_39230/m.91644 type:complete len:249 (-) Transcript_39230:808-1554(-)
MKLQENVEAECKDDNHFERKTRPCWVLCRVQVHKDGVGVVVPLNGPTGLPPELVDEHHKHVDLRVERDHLHHDAASLCVDKVRIFQVLKLSVGLRRCAHAVKVDFEVVSVLLHYQVRPLLTLRLQIVLVGKESIRSRRFIHHLVTLRGEPSDSPVIPLAVLVVARDLGLSVVDRAGHDECGVLAHRGPVKHIRFNALSECEVLNVSVLHLSARPLLDASGGDGDGAHEAVEGGDPAHNLSGGVGDSNG